MRTLRTLLCFSLVLGTAVFAQTQEPEPPSTKPPVKSNRAGGNQEETPESKRAQTGAPEGYSFMGLTLRQSKAEATAIIKAMNIGKSGFNVLKFQGCSGKSGPGLETCGFFDDFPPEYQTGFALTFVDGKLATITYGFRHDGYEAMVRAIGSKYGPPTASHVDVVKNRMGATFEGKAYSWSNTASHIEATEYFETLGTSGIVVGDTELEREEQKRAQSTDPKI